MCSTTRSPNSSSTPGSCSLGRSKRPAGTCTTRCPGSTWTTSGRPWRSARVYVVQSTPAWANAETSSRTYTFIPPLSPDPGCSSGDVWRERTATRCTARSKLAVGRQEALVDVEQRLALLRLQLRVVGDGVTHAATRGALRVEQSGPLVQRLRADLQRRGELAEDVGRRSAQPALDLREVRVAHPGEVGEAAHADLAHLPLGLDELAELGEPLVQLLADVDHLSPRSPVGGRRPRRRPRRRSTGRHRRR